MVGDECVDADARAVLCDGCATVRRVKTHALERFACAEVERTRRRARARRDVLWALPERAGCVERGYSFTRNFVREMTAAVVDGRISCISCETTIDRRGRRTARRCVGEDYKRARRLLVKSDRRGK